MEQKKFIVGMGVIYVGAVLTTKQVVIPGFEEYTGIIGLGLFFLGFVIGMLGLFEESNKNASFQKRN